MKTLILTGLIAIVWVASITAGLALIVHRANAQNEWLRNTEVCTYGTMDSYAAKSIEQGAVEHALNEADTAAMLGLYHGYQNYTVVRLFTISTSVDGALVFGNAHGCAVWRMFRRLTWISHVLGRDIVHPATS